MQRVPRRGSIDEGASSVNATSNQIRDFKCPKCKSYYTLPRIMPCGHRVCTGCIEYLQGRSRDKLSFHCPVLSCSQLCATTAQSLRRDRELERVVQQHRRLESCRGSDTTNAGCQNAGCGSVDVACDKCAHCELRLCRVHFEEHSEIVREGCSRRLGDMKDLIYRIQEAQDRCALHGTNVDHQILESRATLQRILDCLNRQFNESNAALLKIKKDIENSAALLSEFQQKICDLESAIKEALMVEEDDEDSLNDKQHLFSKAERLISHVKLPTFFDDVRFSQTPADVETVMEKIREFKVIQTALQVRTVDDWKLTIECPEQYSKPHCAVLWCRTGDFCVSPGGVLQRRAAERPETGAQAVALLPAEVLLLTNLMKLTILSLDGERLGRIKVDSDGCPLTVKWFDVSPDGRLLALLTTNKDKVLLCDMDGTVKTTIRQESLPGIHSLSSVSFVCKQLVIVDPGNTTHGKPGSVCLIDGPEFDPGQAVRIPLETSRLKIFPMAAAVSRGSYFVLGTMDELLVHSRESRQLIAKIGDSGADPLLQSALHIRSDVSGRVFVCVSRDRRFPASDRPSAEVLVLDPHGRQIGSVSSPDMASCHAISVSEQRGRPCRLVACDPENNLVHVFQLADVADDRV